MWINPKTKETYVMHTDIRVAAGNVSLPRELTDEIIESIGLKPVTGVPQPEHNPQTHDVEPGECVYNEEENRWETSWILRSLSSEEIQQRYDARVAEIRAQRNEKLAACDWTQLPDSPLTNVQQTAWQTYRQALRDITNQADPFNIVWPEKP